MSNLFKAIDHLIPNELIQNYALLQHEKEDAIIKSLQGIIPSILHGLVVSPASNHFLLGNILKSVSSKDENPISQVLDQNGELNKDLVKIGQQFIEALFGTQSFELSNIIANTSGIKFNSCLSMMNVGSSIVVVFLSNKMLAEGLNINNLITWIESHQNEIDEFLPKEFATLVAQKQQVIQEKVDDYESESSESKKWFLPLVLFALIGIGIWYWMQGCNKESQNNTQMNIQVIDSAKNSIDHSLEHAVEQVNQMIDSIPVN